MSDSVQDPSHVDGRLIAASRVNGTAVYNRQGEKLGSIYDVMIEKQSGRADYAIMSFGGFLGIGDSYHPLPWSQLTYDPQQGGYVVDLSRDRLEGAPAYNEADIGVWDEERARNVDEYYAREPIPGFRTDEPAMTRAGV